MRSRFHLSACFFSLSSVVLAVASRIQLNIYSFANKNKMFLIFLYVILEMYSAPERSKTVTQANTEVLLNLTTEVFLGRE